MSKLTRKGKGVANMTHKSGVSRHHSGQCAICKSEFCNEIDELLMYFKPAVEISMEYPQFSHKTVLNHLHATGIGTKRMKNKKRVLEKIIERGMSILKTKDFRLDAGHIIKAVETHAKITDNGELVEKSETKHSGEVTQKIDVSKQVKKQIDGLIELIGGKP